MNKILFYLKYALIGIIIFLYIMFFIEFKFNTLSFLTSAIIILVLFMLIILSVFDIKNKNYYIIYNMIFIFIELLLVFVFIRTLYDPSFIYNSAYYKQLLGKEELIYAKSFNISYLLQNVKFLVIMIFLLMVYRKTIK